VINDVACNIAPKEIAAVGVASMAETGLLLDRRTGTARTPMLPWFDRRPTAYAAQIAQAGDRYERFCATGQYPSFKSTLAKLLWLRERDHSITNGAVWLSAADYIAYRLTGVFATDPTLAVRTYAFRVDGRDWDHDWLRQWGLAADLFPPVLSSGTPVGGVSDHGAQLGLSPGTPVGIAGHDHVCAAFAVGAAVPGTAFDSMGTAEALVGAIGARVLGQPAYNSGLTYGPHVVPDLGYWMGGLSAAGGSVEWFRALLSDPPLPYEALDQLLAAAGDDPTGIVYVPYLLGSGTPHPDPLATGAFIGLRAEHGRADLAKAVLEGMAYELEFIRRTAEHGTGVPIGSLVAAGGGARNRHWLQIKADVHGCTIRVPHIAEATALGAALLAGLGAGVYADAAAATCQTYQAAATVFPNDARHQIYRSVYQQAYLPLQAPLRQLSHTLAHQRAQR
jgi:xylulokinase